VIERAPQAVEALLILASFPVFAMPFSKHIRMMIGKRDNWSCQEPGCDKRFQDGYMVQAAHLPDHHSKDDPEYDTPQAGVILCIYHHMLQHLNGTSLGKAKDKWAADQLKKTDPRTRAWREKDNK
jgi:hypothetical protein